MTKVKYRNDLTAAELREHLSYDPLSGIFTRILSSGGIRAGTVAGWLMDNGYIRISVKGKSYRANRLAWLWMMGEWPPVDVDHTDLCRSNNRWDNLRSASRTQNKANEQRRKDNKSGVKGVYWRRNRWEAQVGKKYIGSFKNIEDAAEAYRVAAAKIFGEFARFV